MAPPRRRLSSRRVDKYENSVRLAIEARPEFVITELLFNFAVVCLVVVLLLERAALADPLSAESDQNTRDLYTRV